ncbi:50S ribosomal protein L23 [Inmirania thermothiophila]|uniref:Large ribosomal subunit protein uL23 n=1 Tax=Inmirania thermothiophila TaxID=1750597 RepID=A0A3N1Y7L4_9GAMM|nr:50S ribosomal protein L23 [Inmirania thermothiophila]ROR34826.1 LSU ribosomal protein L23P [Inmirania thermothiophila]
MNRERLMKILLAPVITEKSTRIADAHRQYAFRVARDATKPEIKRAVETMFEVEVDSVRVVNVHGKRKRFGRTPGRRPDWKKAYVRLREGHEIDFMGQD